MKAIILAGGKGTRISEETLIKPKPLVEIGGKPILWHVLKIYSFYGINEFIICCGYKGYLIKEYFANYFLHMSDVTFDLSTNSMEVHHKYSEPWKVTLIDTGEDTQTGGRLKAVKKYVNEDDDFCFTYGDGVSDINIKETIEFHRKENKFATISAVQAPGRYGALDINNSLVNAFIEKPKGDGGWINGGFFVLNKNIFNFIDGPSSIWELDCLPEIAKLNQLAAFQHKGFWQPMDTLREKNYLDDLWFSERAPWKKWD